MPSRAALRLAVPGCHRVPLSVLFCQPPKILLRCKSSQSCNPPKRPSTLAQPSPCYAKLFSTASPPTNNPQPLPKGTRLISPSSARPYVIEEVLDQRHIEVGLCCVYRASYDGKNYVIKFVRPNEFEAQVKLQKLIEHSPHVRTAVDAIPDRHFLVFPFLETLLLLVNTKALSPTAKKHLIRDSLIGLADLHDKRIIHTDIKPTNIMMDLHKGDNGSGYFHNVQITDLDDAYVIPEGTKGIAHVMYGNCFWRSPESWARALQNTPSDIFSFGIVAIYVWLDHMVLFSEEANNAPPEEQSRLIFKKFLSYFGSNPDDIAGFVEYHGGEEAAFVNRVLDSIDLENDQVLPFPLWDPVDEQFKDLVAKMVRLDPRRRITAREALLHPFFGGL